MRPDERRRLGASGNEVTLLGFGATSIGNLYRAVSDDDAQATLEAVWAARIRYFDTAPLYGVSLSERRLGEFLSGKPRDSFCLSTKVGRVLEPAEAHQRMPAAIYPDVPSLRPRFDYSRAGILRSFEESLRRLRMDHVDILYLHDLAPMNHATPEAYEHHYKIFFQEGGYQAMLDLRKEGRTRSIGMGIGAWPAAERLLRDGDFDACLLAGRYTLLEQTALRSFLPMCLQRGVGVVIGGPYNSGILATGAVEGAMYNYRPASAEILNRVRRIEEVCRMYGVPLIAAALQFPLRHPAVASVIPGLGTPAELDSAIEALSFPIPEKFYRNLAQENLISREALDAN